MKYIIYEVEQRGEVRIALDAKDDDYALRSDEMEVSEDEATNHVYGEHLPVSPKRVTTFGRMDQSYPQLRKLMVSQGLAAF